MYVQFYKSALFLASGMAVVDFTDDLVLPASSEREVRISGYPEGSWLNLIAWSEDSKHIAFTIRSPGPTPTACTFPRLNHSVLLADI